MTQSNIDRSRQLVLRLCYHVTHRRIGEALLSLDKLFTPVAHKLPKRNRIGIYKTLTRLVDEIEDAEAITVALARTGPCPELDRSQGDAR